MNFGQYWGYDHSRKLILTLKLTSEIKWDTKENRSKWEEYFQSIIESTFRNHSTELEKARQTLKKINKEDDQSQQIFFMAYELNDGIESFPNVYSNKELWKYKPQVNIAILTTEITCQTKSEEFILLKKFIELESHVKLLRNAAESMRFLNFLRMHYRKNLFKYYASNFSMKNILLKKTLQKR